MSDPQEFSENNEAYLAAALHWLRLRLYAHIRQIEIQETEDRTPKSRFLRPVRAGDEQASLPPLLSPTPAELASAQEAMQVAASQKPTPRLVRLAETFRLTAFETQILLLCAALELDTRLPGLCARAQDNPNRTYPTFALALALFDAPEWSAISPERPLRYLHLVEINQPSGQPLVASGLRADERIANSIKGLDYLDERLAALMLPLELPLELSLPPSQETAVSGVVSQVAQAKLAQRSPLVQLVGSDSASKQRVAGRAAAQLGAGILRLPSAMFPTVSTETEALARLWGRESSLLNLVLYLEAPDDEAGGAPEGRLAALQRFLLRSGGVIFLDTREPRLDLGRATGIIDIDKPTPAEQRQAWQAALGEQADGLPDALAGQFNFNLDGIQHLTALARNGNSHLSLGERLWQLCLNQTRPHLGGLAQRIEPVATWEDIVLPEEQLRLLRQVADQVQRRSLVYDEWGFRDKTSRGLGISALFAGPSGTGKTMAAEVIANHLNLNLYRIDLSSVVSKYIGETEKNLRRLFDAAEDGGAILFFDEADALFGKRSEVKDSHDRYANIEINYLLQRMEAYRGLAILATNMKGALDAAFLRRLRFIVNFPFPGLQERREIWRRVFPVQAPLLELDYERLARLNLTGGSIHNIALNAAFLAAHKSAPVDMLLVLEAVRDELRKLERPINEVELRWEQVV